MVFMLGDNIQRSNRLSFQQTQGDGSSRKRPRSPEKIRGEDSAPFYLKYLYDPNGVENYHRDLKMASSAKGSSSRAKTSRTETKVSTRIAAPASRSAGSTESTVQSNSSSPLYHLFFSKEAAERIDEEGKIAQQSRILLDSDPDIARLKESDVQIDDFDKLFDKHLENVRSDR